MRTTAALLPKTFSELSPGAAVAAAFFPSLLPFVAVELFPGRLLRTFDVPSYLILHNVTEFFSVMVSLSIFGIGWFAYAQSRDRRALFLGAAFLAIGLIDGMHTLSYAGMPAFVTPNSPDKAARFWVAVRFVGAVSFLASACIGRDSASRWLSKPSLATAALVVTGTVFAAIIFFPSHLPATFVEGVGLTRFKVVAECVIVAVLVLAIAAHWRRALQAGDGLLNYYLAAFVVCIFSELSFTVYRSAFDTLNMLGHAYKVAAFLLIYRGIFIASIDLPYARLATATDSLQRDVRERAYTEEALRKSEERFRRTLDDMMEGCMLIGFDWRYLYVNASAARHGRRSRKDLVGRTVQEAYPGAEGSAVFAGYRRCMVERVPLRFEAEYTFPDATTNWFEFTVEPVPEGIFVFFLDITERKGAEDALRAAGAYNRSLIEASLDPLVTIGPDGAITDVNAATEAVTGRSRGELIGTDFSNYFTEPERARAGYRQVFRDGFVRDYELEICHRDGKVTPVLYNASVYRSLSGDVLGVFAAARDITSTRLAQQALLMRERQLEVLAEAGQRVNTVLDIPVIMRTLVAAAIDLVEASSGGAGLLIEGKMVFREYSRAGNVVPVDYVFERGRGVPGHVMDTGQCYISNDVERDPHVIREIQRDLGYYNVVAVPILDRMNNLLGCFAIHNTRDRRPFTENDAALLRGLAAAAAVALENAQLLAEQIRTAETLTRLATAVEQAGEAIIITDVDGAIRYVNPAFTRITGYGRGEVLGRNPRFLKSGKQDEAFYRKLWETLLRGDVWSGVFVNRRKEGTLYEEQAVISPVKDASGKIVNFVGVKRDVTNERLLEQQLRQSQKLEAVGRLAGGIAHDFNNLLTVVIGYCELAVGRRGAPEPVRHDLEEIRHAADRCAALTQQLLAFSRKQILVPRVFNLNDVVRDMDRMLRRLIGEDVELVSRFGKDLWNVKADPGQIEQVVVNLAVNARDAMPRGGKLTIETANVVSEEFRTRRGERIAVGAHVMLAVTDTGCGMDEATLDKIFEPFFTTKETGTGLGLPTALGIVEQSGGHIDVASRPGAGTTFRIYFPCVEEAVTAVRESAAAPPEALRGKETILLVEDEDLVRQMVREILAHYGYTVLEARNGREALDLCAAHAGAVHMMLTDVVMPDMSGKELSEEVAPLQPGMKVLFMSGYTSDAIVHRGVLESGVAFIQKPFAVTSLARKTREVLDSGLTMH